MIQSNKNKPSQKDKQRVENCQRIGMPADDIKNSFRIADRLALISEKGEPVGEEYSLSIAVQRLLERYKDKKPTVVKNTSTSQVIDDIATDAGAEVLDRQGSGVLHI